MNLAGNYRVNTSDLGEAAAILGAEYGSMRIARATQDAQPWIRIWRTRVGPVTFDDVDISSDIRYEIGNSHGVLLCRIRAGDVDFGFGRQRRSFGRGDMVVLAADGETMTGVLSEARLDLVSFDKSMLDELADLGYAVPCGTPLQHFATPINPSAGQQVADVIDHIRRFVANNPMVAHESLVAISAARYLAATMLMAFPGAALTM